MIYTSINTELNGEKLLQKELYFEMLVINLDKKNIWHISSYRKYSYCAGVFMLTNETFR